MPSIRRLDLEAQALRTYFPQFKIQDPYGSNGGVVGHMTTNHGNVYVVWLPLGNFPNEAPQMYIVSPTPLLSYDRRALASIGASSSMHLLAPDAHGHPQICHYNGQYWHPKVSLYKIVMKARFWLEAYEQHLTTGEAIDKYLSHM